MAAPTARPAGPAGGPDAEDATDAPGPTDTADAVPFDRLLAPRSVAVVGSVSRPDRMGARTVAHLEAARFPGEVVAVSRPEDLEVHVDVAVVAVPAASVPATLERLRGRADHAVVYSSGFAETGAGPLAGHHHGDRRILGPNTVGLYVAPSRAVLSFARALDDVTDCRGGSGAVLVSQSGAFGARLVSAARKRGLHLDGFVATGNEDGYRLADVLDGVSTSSVLDPGVLLVYVEAMRDPQGLAASIRAARARGRRVVVLPGGRSASGAGAAASHTGALTADAAVVEELLVAAGATLVRSDRELLDAAVALGVCRPARGRRVGVLTGSGGAGVVAADLAAAHDLVVPALGAATRDRLAELLPDYAAVTNPVDVTASVIADADVLGRCVSLLVRSGEVDMVLTVGRAEHAAVVGEAAGEVPAVLTLLDGVTADTRPLVEDGTAAYGDLAGGATALAALAPPPGPAGPLRPPVRPRPVPDTATGGPGGAAASLAMVAAAGVATAPWRRARSVDAARAAGEALGWPVVLKVDGAAGDHKARGGGVALGVTAATVAGEAERLLAAAGGGGGLVVAQQLPRATELLAGVRRDALLGPVAVAGLGGGDAELIRRVVALPAALPTDWIARRIREDVLAGAPGADRTARALAETVARLAQLAEDGGLSLVECNPLIETGDGLVALDARVVSP